MIWQLLLLEETKLLDAAVYDISRSRRLRFALCRD